MTWHIKASNEHTGPLSTDELVAMAARGEIPADAYLWRRGMDSWANAIELLKTIAPSHLAPLPDIRSKTTAATPATPSMTKTRAGPWARCWAKGLDLQLFLAPLIIGAQVAFPDAFTLDNPIFSWVLGLVLFPLAVPIEAAVYALFGNTPGKWLCGIRVLDARGGKLTFGTYVSRGFKVYFAGLGAGIAIITLITLLKSYREVLSGDLPSWDRTLETQVVRINFVPWRTASAGVLCLAIIAAFITKQALSQSPENMLRLSAKFASVGTPKMIDEQTELDSVEALPGLVLQYNLSLVDADANLGDKNALGEAFQGDIRNDIRANICSEENLRNLRNLGTKFRYVYRDKKGEQLGQVEISSVDCK